MHNCIYKRKCVFINAIGPAYGLAKKLHAQLHKMCIMQMFTMGIISFVCCIIIIFKISIYLNLETREENSFKCIYKYTQISIIRFALKQSKDTQGFIYLYIYIHIHIYIINCIHEYTTQPIKANIFAKEKIKTASVQTRLRTLHMNYTFLCVLSSRIQLAIAHQNTFVYTHSLLYIPSDMLMLNVFHNEHIRENKVATAENLQTVPYTTRCIIVVVVVVEVWYTIRKSQG